MTDDAPNLKTVTDGLLFGEGIFTPQRQDSGSILGEMFVVPPFSVFNAQQGYWQTRKRAWMRLGIKSELGRGDVLFAAESQNRLNEIMKMDSGKGRGDNLLGVSQTQLDHLRKKQLDKADLIKSKSMPAGLAIGEIANYDGANREMTGTSIFDPVLCELMYKWFSPPGGKILDCFAGGSVRGVVAAALGRYYTGCELRGEQVQANREQWEGLRASVVPRLPQGPVLRMDGVFIKRAYMSDAPIPAQCENVPWGSVTRVLTSGPVEEIRLAAAKYAAELPQLPEFKHTAPRDAAVLLHGEHFAPADAAAAMLAQPGDLIWMTTDPGERCVWAEGDSTHIQNLCPGGYDMLFTCPPYADLEVYSADVADLSNKEYPEFVELYTQIIKNSAAMLRDDSFAVIVVGEVRGPGIGAYRNFVGDTIKAAEAAGLQYYNEAILVTAIGSLPVRAKRQFLSGRKIGKTHQNILGFVKGDPKRAAYKCGRDDLGVP